MIEIKDLLLNFSKLLLSEEVRKESVRETILKITKVPIKKEEIKIKNGTLYLNIKPIYKNEIFIKREQIISELEAVLGKKTPQNFR